VFSLAGKKALVVGIANEDSIAFGCAKAFRTQGAELAITFQGEKTEPSVRAIGRKLETDIILPLDVRDDGQFETLFDSIRRLWGRVDICLHSIAFCPKQDLHSRVVDCSREGFITAMDISVHSFIRMVRLAEPLMPAGSACMTVSFLGSEKVVEHYNIMGPVKAALEAVSRYMAAELGPKGIRVHTLSPGPLRTRAASGIGHFDELLNDTAARAPTHQLASIEDVGAYAAFLASAEAASVTGGIYYIDGGYHIVG
jgi:enoyl-[acyl-carrier protein] reductase I